MKSSISNLSSGLSLYIQNLPTLAADIMKIKIYQFNSNNELFCFKVFSSNDFRIELELKLQLISILAMVRIRFTILEKVSRWELPSSSPRYRQDRACSDASPPSGIRRSSDSASHLHCSSLRVAPSDRVSGHTDSSGGLSCKSIHPGEFICPASGRSLAAPATRGRSLSAPPSGRSLIAPATFSSRGMLAPASGRSFSAPATSSRGVVAPASGRSLSAPATSSRGVVAPASGRSLIAPATFSSRSFKSAPASGRSLSAPATSSRGVVAPASGRSLSAPATSSRGVVAPASGRSLIAPATFSSRGIVAPASGRSLSAPATSSRGVVAPASGRSLSAPPTGRRSLIAPASGRSVTTPTSCQMSKSCKSASSLKSEACPNMSKCLELNVLEKIETVSSHMIMSCECASALKAEACPKLNSSEKIAAATSQMTSTETKTCSQLTSGDSDLGQTFNASLVEYLYNEHQTSILTDEPANKEKLVFTDVLNEVLTSYNAALEGGAEVDKHYQLYTPCDCKKCDCEQSNCSCNPCSNVWFNWRLADQLAPQPALVHIFKESALKEMLHDSELTVSVAAQIFDIPLPTVANLVETEMLLIQLSNEFEFTLIDTQFGNGLNMTRLGGGGKRPKKRLGRPRKRRKIVVAADDENNIFLIDKSDPSILVRLGDAGDESDSADSSVVNEAGVINANSDNSDLDDVNSIISQASESLCDILDVDTAQSKDTQQKKRADRQKKFSNSFKGKATLKRYRSKKKGKDALKKAYDRYSQEPEGKAALKKARDKYFQKPEGKAALKGAQDKYFQKPEGKAALKGAQDRYFQKPEGKAALKGAQDKYFQKPEGKAALKEAHDKYVQKPQGKAAQKEAQDKYVQKPQGKAARKRANVNYVNSEHGRLVKEAANQAYLERVKDKRIPRKKADSIRKKYMKRYMRYYRECDKIVVDFSQENIPGNTKALQEHVVRPEIIKKFQYQGNEVLKCRSLTTAPTRYCAGNMRNAAAYYKLRLGTQLSSSMSNISDGSWGTIPGVTKKALKRFIHFRPELRAAKLLANLTWLKRKQCVDALKMFHLRLSSFADAVISKMSTQEKESDKKAALLGLQCHKKMSEPYHHKVSYVDGNPYNYKGEAQKFEEAKKSNNKNPSHLIYKCNDGCIIPDTNEDLTKLSTLFDECRNLSESNTSGFRKYLENFQLCTKWEEYDDSVKRDLNPNRMYLFPVTHKNHPETCYHTCDGNDDSKVKHTKCASQEVTLRKFMVHYTNPRKFYTLISNAIVTHKLMCDIDAATILGDVEYLSKLVKINIQYEAGSSVGFSSVSEARNWTSRSMEEVMAEVAIKGKTSRTTFSHRDIFDRDRNELPSIRCYCCDKLVTPVHSTTINLKTAKKLEYNPEKGLQPPQVFQDFQAYLVEKGTIQTTDSNVGDDEVDFTNHPTKHLHGLTICKSCRMVLNKGEIPSNSVMNNMFTGETPEVLKVLNPIELMFVSRTKCFQTIVKPGPISSKLPHGDRLNALKGNLIHIPLSTATTTKRLYESKNKSATESLLDVEDLVQLYGQPTKDKKIWNYIVDRKKVHAALTWLHENNPNYKDIIVPALAEDILPHVFGYVCNLCQKEFDSEEELSEHKKNYPNCGDLISNGSQSKTGENSTSSKIMGYMEKLFVAMNIIDPPKEEASSSPLQCDDGSSNVPSEPSDNESSPDSDVPCPDGQASSSSSTDYFSSSDDENDTSDAVTDKPWIEQVPKESLNNAFQQFSVVGNESNPELDTFKMLKIGSDPVPYYEPNLDCMAFPDRYPYGSGGLTAHREKNLTDAIFEQTRLMTWNNHQRRNLPYLFHLLAQKEKRLIKSAIFSVLNKNFKTLTKNDIEKGAIEENPALLRSINSVLQKLPTQKEYWYDVKTKLEAAVFEFGAPTFWTTFSPGEYEDEEMLEYLQKRNSDLPGVEKMTVSQLVCKDPVLASTYLQTKFDSLLKLVLSNSNIIGKVKHHFVRTEYQTRLMPHFHCLFWIEDAPLIGQDSDEDVLNFIGKYISCKMPSPNDDPTMHGLVKKFQLHRCNSYCLRHPKKFKGKARCKFGFPRAACNKPILHGVATSIASHKTGSYKKRLYELQRDHHERCINDYNPMLLYLWQGNIDMQFIGEKSESLVDYISKYATKAPRSEITDFDLNAMKNENKSTWAQLFQAASRLMKDREVGAMEARNFMLSENPVKTDATFLFINAVYASKRKSMLKRKKELDNLPDDSTDIFYGDLIGTWYPKRPPYDGPLCLKDMSLLEFARTYERIGDAAANQLKNKSGLLRLDGNAGFMRKRSPEKIKSLVIYGPSYLDPFKDSEAYYYSYLLLHKPFWDESSLMGSSDSFKQEFDKLKPNLPAMAAHEEKVRTKKNFREAMEKSAEAAADEMASENVEDDAQNVDNGSDLFETIRKQSTIETEEQLDETVAGLSPDQFAVYDVFVKNVDHYYQHKTKTCSCENFEPVRLFVSGFGGSGKSHLIRTLMAYQFIKSEVKKEPCHFLLGAPTGIASHNIGGMTLHSMWNLPVDHSKGRKNSAKEYQKLKSGQINVMRANYRHACGMIIDEVSMISNQMLMAIHLRMNEVIGLKDPAPFGGMPIVVLGDLFQLEPVSGSQPFVPLTPGITKKMFGGFPCAPNLWGGFDFRQLNTNHRQKGEENVRWRTILDHVRFGMLTSSDVDHLNKRIIDTSGCKLKAEYLERYVTNFLECENAGLGPVCLMPENKMVDEFNVAVMQKKGQVPTTITAEDKLQCPKDKENLVHKLVSNLDSDETAGLEHYIKVAVNTRVMLRVNDKRTPGLVNGARGTVCEMVMDKKGKVSKIMVQFDGIDAIQSIERIERKFNVLPKCYVYRTMFPLINSYAMTIHKSQSMSLPCVFADLGDKVFADGMSYVGLSRCLKHEGLHLLNFNPAKVVASEKACKEYSRLLGKGSIPHNQGCKSGKLERRWYTTSVTRKAAKVTAEEIKNTVASKQSGSASGVPAKKKKVNSSKSKKGSAPSGKQKPITSYTTSPATAKSAKPVTTKVPSSKGISKKFIPKNTPPPNEKPVVTPVEVSSSNNDEPVITGQIGTLISVTIDYVPVNEGWQRSICTALNLNFIRPSRPSYVSDEYRVSKHKPPTLANQVGSDGNCWYRTISHIVTGDERYWRSIKNAVLGFMEANISVLQCTYNNNVLVRLRDHVFGGPDVRDGNFAKRLIAYHKKDNIWARNAVMEITAIMLNARWYLFVPPTRDEQGRITHPAFWQSIEDNCYFWNMRDRFTSLPVLPQLSKQSMYINWPGMNHFEPCQNGLDERNSH